MDNNNLAPLLYKRNSNISNHIENLGNSCGNAKVSRDCKDSESIKLSMQNLTKNCPELTHEQLNNFCYYNQACKLICPQNKITDTEEYTNLNQIINKTISINNISGKKNNVILSNLYTNAKKTITSYYNPNPVNNNNNIENLSNSQPSSSDSPGSSVFIIIIIIIVLIILGVGGYYAYTKYGKKKPIQSSSESSSS